MTEELTEFEWVCVQAIRLEAGGATHLTIDGHRMQVECEEMIAVIFRSLPSVVWHYDDRSTATEHESPRDAWETFLREERKVWGGGEIPGEENL